MEICCVAPGKKAENTHKPVAAKSDVLCFDYQMVSGTTRAFIRCIIPETEGIMLDLHTSCVIELPTQVKFYFTEVWP